MKLGNFPWISTKNVCIIHMWINVIFTLSKIRISSKYSLTCLFFLIIKARFPFWSFRSESCKKHLTPKKTFGVWTLPVAFHLFSIYNLLGVKIPRNFGLSGFTSKMIWQLHFQSAKRPLAHDVKSTLWF